MPDRFDGGALVVDAIESDGDAEQRPHPGPYVVLVVTQRLAGPVAGDEDAPAADAEGVPLVDLALAAARLELRVCLLRLNAAEQPVRAAVGAGGQVSVTSPPTLNLRQSSLSKSAHRWSSSSA